MIWERVYKYDKSSAIDSTNRVDWFPGKEKFRWSPNSRTSLFFIFPRLPRICITIEIRSLISYRRKKKRERRERERGRKKQRKTKKWTDRMEDREWYRWFCRYQWRLVKRCSGLGVYWSNDHNGITIGTWPVQILRVAPIRFLRV